MKGGCVGSHKMAIEARKGGKSRTKKRMGKGAQDCLNQIYKKINVKK
jgi:hypothetical protein